jgi:hypothetical protein
MLIATTGIASKGPSPGSNRGAQPATLVSPDYPAKEKTERPTDQHDKSLNRKFGTAVLSELTERARSLPEPDAVEGEAEEIEIESVFRRRIAGLRHLPKRERPSARKAARDWRIRALKALREQRARDRQARRVHRQLSGPTPN